MRTAVVLLLLGHTALHAQECLPEGITFTDQAGIDAFAGTHPGCTTIQGQVTINGAGITNVDGLGGITALPGGLFLHACPALTDLSGLAGVGTLGFLHVNDCDALQDLSGLGGVGAISGFLMVQENAQLQHLTGLGSLTSVGEFVMVRANAALIDLSGLDALQSVGDYLSVAEDPSLTTLAGLDALTSVGAYISVSSCAQLGGLTALSALTSVGTFVQVSGLPLITSLEGLEHVDPTPLMNYNVLNCPQLSECAVASLCGYLASGGGASISGNGPGCTTMAEVQDACSTLSIGEPAPPAMTIGPNPAHGRVTLHVQDPAARHLRLLDQAGRVLRTQRIAAAPVQIQLEGLPAGTYLLQLLDGEHLLAHERLVVLP